MNHVMNHIQNIQKKSGQAPLDVKPLSNNHVLVIFPGFTTPGIREALKRKRQAMPPAAQGYAAWADLFSAMTLAEGGMMIGWLHIPQDGAPVR